MPLGDQYGRIIIVHRLLWALRRPNGCTYAELMEIGGCSYSYVHAFIRVMRGGEGEGAKRLVYVCGYDRDARGAPNIIRWRWRSAAQVDAPKPVKRGNTTVVREYRRKSRTKAAVNILMRLGRAEPAPAPDVHVYEAQDKKKAEPRQSVILDWKAPTKRSA